MHRFLMVAFTSMVLVLPSLAMADSIYGTCTNASGEKCLKNNHRISTSWNSTKGYPDSSGNYEIDFSGSVGTTITVYCDGNKVGTVSVTGRTRFNVRCK